MLAFTVVLVTAIKVAHDFVKEHNARIVDSCVEVVSRTLAIPAANPISHILSKVGNTANSGGDLVSTGVSKQRRACQGPVTLLNRWKHYKRKRRAFRSSRLTPAGRCTSLLMG